MRYSGLLFFAGLLGFLLLNKMIPTSSDALFMFFLLLVVSIVYFLLREPAPRFAVFLAKVHFMLAVVFLGVWMIKEINTTKKIIDSAFNVIGWILF